MNYSEDQNNIDIDNTKWYDRIINQFINADENPELATPLQQGEETPSQTSSSTSSQGTS